MRPRILLIGKNGQIGYELERVLSSVGELHSLGRQQLDISNESDLRDSIRQTKPDVLINAAAYTAVDRAESDENTAYDINVHAPRVMAEEAKELDALLIHYSTDYVFDGLKNSPYEESDLPNPLGVYGRTKLQGEQAIRAIAGHHLILRTAWLYSTRGHNFLLTILRSASQYQVLRIVNDQTGAPTWCREIGRATTSLLKHIFDQEDVRSEVARVNGTYHVTAEGTATWWDFARAIIEETQKVRSNVPWIAASTGGRPLIARDVLPILSEQYPTVARRPAYSVLSTSLLRYTFGLSLAHWREQLQAAFLS